MIRLNGAVASIQISEDEAVADGRATSISWTWPGLWKNIAVVRPKDEQRKSVIWNNEPFSALLGYDRRKLVWKRISEINKRNIIKAVRREFNTSPGSHSVRR